MASELLAVGATAVSSSDLVVASGDHVTVGLKGSAGDNASPDALVKIQVKGDATNYYDVGEMGNGGPRSTVITAAGTYRFTRVANGHAVGVFRA